MRDLEDVFLRHWKMILPGFLGVVVVSILITAGVSILRRPPTNPETGRTPGPPVLEGAAMPLDTSRYIRLPEEPDIFVRRMVRFRRPDQEWSEQDMEKLWYDPGPISVQHLRDANFEKLQDFFQEIR
jgi:hypothetical protein